MADESHLERTEPASPRRLEKAREEGQVARSPELTTFVMLMAAGGGMWLTGEHLAGALRALLGNALRFDASVAESPATALALFERLSVDGLLAVAPFLLIVVLAALVAPQLLGGWLISAVRFDFGRIDPLAGWSRLASWNAFADLGKALVKALVVGAVAAAVIWHYREPVLELTSLPLPAGIVHAARLVGASFLLIAAALGLVAAADVPLQLKRHADNLKMSREEVRREMKETEGDPQVKAAIRTQQRAIARRRMMAEVPKADVIVTNPAHYAVALRYEDGAMRAPRVVAKGADLVAAKIREIGASHRVPVLESPALARALYRHAEIGAEIPVELYTAVAEILAYVFQLRRHEAHGGAAPHPLQPVHVPAGLDPNGESR